VTKLPDDFELPGFVYNPRFEAELEFIEPNTKAAAQIIHSLEFSLIRDPERGWPVPGTPYRMWPVYDSRGRECVVF
jgi:hypothetical protein